MIMRTLAAVLALTTLAITSTYADAQSAIPDFSMLIQQHCIKNSDSSYDVLLACEKSQWQAVRKLQALAQIGGDPEVLPDQFNSVVDVCLRKWWTGSEYNPDVNFDMTLRCVNSQIAALKESNRMHLDKQPGYGK
jgi:hypothetical protein